MEQEESGANLEQRMAGDHAEGDRFVDWLRSAEAVDELYRECAKIAYKSAKRLLGPNMTMDEVVNDIWIRLLLRGDQVVSSGEVETTQANRDLKWAHRNREGLRHLFEVGNPRGAPRYLARSYVRLLEEIERDAGWARMRYRLSKALRTARDKRRTPDLCYRTVPSKLFKKVNEPFFSFASTLELVEGVEERTCSRFAAWNAPDHRLVHEVIAPDTPWQASVEVAKFFWDQCVGAARLNRLAMVTVRDLTYFLEAHASFQDKEVAFEDASVAGEGGDADAVLALFEEICWLEDAIREKAAGLRLGQCRLLFTYWSGHIAPQEATPAVRKRRQSAQFWEAVARDLGTSTRTARNRVAELNDRFWKDVDDIAGAISRAPGDHVLATIATSLVSALRSTDLQNRSSTPVSIGEQGIKD